MEIFYFPVIDHEEIILDPGESVHAVKVLRLREHDPVKVVDGRGNLCEGVVVEAHSKKCRIRLHKLHTEFEKRNYRLHLAVAPTKNSDRIEWFLEKATEIGIDEFSPLICRFSERKQVNHDRLEKVAIAAMKQSQKAWLPVIHPEITFDRFIRLPFDGDAFIAHCYPGEKPHLKDVVVQGHDVLILVGPEGDFSQEEVLLAKEQGFREVTLGNSRLRTETAALAACQTVALLNS